MWTFLSLAEFNLNWHFNLFPIWSFVLIIVSRKLLTKNLILLEDKKIHGTIGLHCVCSSMASKDCTLQKQSLSAVSYELQVDRF